MDILQTAIKAEGGVGKLADALGIRQNVISNWRARGVPRSWCYALRLKYMPELAPAPASTAQAATQDIAVSRVKFHDGHHEPMGGAGVAVCQAGNGEA